jgi:hypothetical protein
MTSESAAPRGLLRLRARGLAWLPALPLAACAADVALTLHGQPESYWQGDYGSVIEGNPIPRWFLEVHPLAFAGLVLAWVGTIVVGLRVLPRRWAVTASLAIVFGHTVGAASWLLRDGPARPWLAGGFVLAVASLGVLQ